MTNNSKGSTVIGYISSHSSNGNSGSSSFNSGNNESRTSASLMITPVVVVAQTEQEPAARF